MRHIALAIGFAGALALSGSAFAQQPASTDGKSVPMQQAPSKIQTGKSKAKRHHDRR